MPDKDCCSFPKTKEEALTMLYLQKQDISNMTPEQLVALYKETFEKIKESLKSNWTY